MTTRYISSAKVLQTTKGDTREKITDDICYLIGYVQWDNDDEPLKFLMSNFTVMDLALIREELRNK